VTQPHIELDADGLPVPDPDFAKKHEDAFMDFLTAPGELGDDRDFDMWAVDPGAWRALSELIPGLIVTSAGGVCPFQSQGTLHGLPYYFKYRHEFASLQVGQAGKDPFSDYLYHAGFEYGDEGHSIDGLEFGQLMLRLVPALERAPFLWQFQGVSVDIEDAANPSEPRDEIGNPPPKTNPMDLRVSATEHPEVYHGWGITAAEGYAHLHEPSEWLVEKGWSEEFQAEMRRAEAIDPTPLNDDDRVFPDPEPVFEVRLDA
jgi:hypothetical protein